MSNDETISAREEDGRRLAQSREAILRKVRLARPPAAPLPEIQVERAGPPGEELVARFTSALEAAAGAVWRAAGVEEAVASAYPDAAMVASPEPGWDFAPLADRDPADVDVLVCRGDFGVAENGAVWLPESRMGIRAAPYLAQHLVLVLDRAQIVPDMHHAYARLDVAEEGFGAFIAGPSKTADIEQSLVIGAHGPRSLTVLLVG